MFKNNKNTHDKFHHSEIMGKTQWKKINNQFQDDASPLLTYITRISNDT